MFALAVSCDKIDSSRPTLYLKYICDCTADKLHTIGLSQPQQMSLKQLLAKKTNPTPSLLLHKIYPRLAKVLYNTYMFIGSDKQPKSNSEMLQEILQEIDAIKRYTGNTYANTDNEVSEIKSLCTKIEAKMSEMDRQIDKIEGFERGIDEIRSTLKSLERKVR